MKASNTQKLAQETARIQMDESILDFIAGQYGFHGPYALSGLPLDFAGKVE